MLSIDLKPADLLGFQPLLDDNYSNIGERIGWLMLLPPGRVSQDPMLRNIQFWKLTVNGDRSALLVCERYEGDVAVSQESP